jgi:hypothetical protein
LILHKKGSLGFDFFQQTQKPGEPRMAKVNTSDGMPQSQHCKSSFGFRHDERSRLLNDWPDKKVAGCDLG